MARKHEPRYQLNQKPRKPTSDNPSLHQEDAWVEHDLDDDWTVALRLSTTAGTTIVSELRVFPRGDDSDWRPKPEKPSLGKRRSKPTRQLGQWKADTHGWGVKAGWMQELKRGVTSSLLRQIKLDALVTATDEFQEDMREKNDGSGWARDMARWGFDSALPETARRERRKGLTDLQFARLAKQYVTRVQKGSRRPILDLAQSRNEGPTRTRNLIHQTRQHGFLTRTLQGAKGGALTAKALELLERSKK
jgi:hypothetical protein